MTTPSTDVAAVVVPRAQELVSRHVDRSRQYRMTAKLLAAPPDEAGSSPFFFEPDKPAEPGGNPLGVESPEPENRRLP